MIDEISGLVNVKFMKNKSEASTSVWAHGGGAAVLAVDPPPTAVDPRAVDLYKKRISKRKKNYYYFWGALLRTVSRIWLGVSWT